MKQRKAKFVCDTWDFISIIHLILLYGETVMAILHIWIVIGYALPSLQDILSQPQWMTNLYILSDLSLPLLTTAAIITMGNSNNTFQPPNAANMLKILLVVAHSILYLIFLYDNKQMIPVMEWAYSDWIHRKKQLLFCIGDDDDEGKGGIVHPCLAVILDTVCHSWGVYTLLLLKNHHHHHYLRQQQKEVDGSNNEDTENYHKLIVISLGVIVAGVTIAILGSSSVGGKTTT